MTMLQSYYYTYRRIAYRNSFTRRMTYLYIPQRVYYYTYEDLVTDNSTAKGDSIRSW